MLRVAYGDVDPVLLLRAGSRPPREVAVVPDTAHDHGDEIRAVVLELDQVVDWTAFGIWLTMLLHARGSDLYRVKGLLDVGGDGPLLVNGVQHAVHPPVHLDSWPDGERRSRLVVIGRGVEAERADRVAARVRPRGSALARGGLQRPRPHRRRRPVVRSAAEPGLNDPGFSAMLVGRAWSKAFDED